MIELRELHIKVKVDDNSSSSSRIESEPQRERTTNNSDDKINEILEQVSRILKNKKER